MGGAKETPRQKMISMMYIVLTALLALNVSKQILEAYIAIEENIQLANISESDRGNDKWLAIEEKAMDKVEKSQKAIELFKLAKELDKITSEQIQLLDEAKLATLKELGEPQIEPKKDGNKEIGVIIDERVVKGKIKINITGEKPTITFTETTGGEPLSSIVPIRMNLRNVKGADKYDEGMRVMGLNGNGSLKAPSPDKYGMKIWNGMIAYRGKLIDIVCKSGTAISKLEADSGKVGKTYSFKDPLLGVKATNTNFESPTEIIGDNGLLAKKGALKTVSPKDAQFISELYASLCKNDLSVDEETGEEFHWIGRTFDHAPGVAVLAALSSLQKEVLKARSEVMIYLQSEVGGSDYSFNKVIGLARPLNPVVAGGQEFFVEVQAAAFDSEREPIIDTKGQGEVVSIKNGVALVKFRATGNGEMAISGTIAVKKKTGQSQTMPYETSVTIAPKAGSLEMPEFNILYRGYQNIIIPAASGVANPTINASGCQQGQTTYQGKKGYWVKPGNGVKTVTISLSGQDENKKSVNFGSWTYTVKKFPSPIVLNSTVSKSSGAKIKVGMSPESPLQNVKFQVFSIDAGEQTFGGDIIPATAVAKIKIGKSLGVNVTYKNLTTGGPLESVPGFLKVQ
ncbi:MAG: hypothetical protein EB023_06835 [Flavobacteriia bacterium]|nr:hypothetical protein [Flavobacteriia bacterium]